MQAKPIEGAESTKKVTKQTGITKVTKSTKIPCEGALWVFNPLGSSYRDPNTKETVIREEPTLQYAKAGVPQKYGLGLSDMKNFELFFQSKEWAEIKQVLPETAHLEPNSV